VSWAVVMTKADKLKPTPLKAVCDASAEMIARHVAAYPHIFVTSSQEGDGIAELRAHLAGLALPRG